MYQPEVGSDSLEQLRAWVSVCCQHPKGVKVCKRIPGNPSSFAKRDRSVFFPECFWGPLS